MRILFCSDLHGHEPSFVRLINAAGTTRPDVVILGGDMLPDDSAMVPERLGLGQPEFVRRRFKDLLITIRRASECQALLAISGNHEWISSMTELERLAEEGLLSVLRHTQAVEVQGLRFVGFGHTPPTPWYVKDFERLDIRGDRTPLLGGARWDERLMKAISHNSNLIYEKGPTLADELASLHVPEQPWVFVAHAPPYDSLLDRSRDNVPWGSRAVRGAIEKHQPLLSLHGHIHDSPSVTGRIRDEIGRTVAVNPGQTRRVLQYALIEVDVSGRRVVSVEHGQLA